MAVNPGVGDGNTQKSKNISNGNAFFGQAVKQQRKVNHNKVDSEQLSTDVQITTHVEKPVIIKTNATPIWYEHAGLYFEENLFRQGIVAFTTKKNPAEEKRADACSVQISGTTFKPSDRKLVNCKLKHQQKELFNEKKNKIIRAIIPQITVPDSLKEKEIKAVIDAYSRAQKNHDLLKVLTRNKGISSFENGSFIVNVNRIEEVLFPVDTGVYIYPWISKYNKKHKKLPDNFEGFNKVVTAICIGGHAMRAWLGNDATIPILKHDLEMTPGQIIDAIEADDVSKSPYDQMVFNELETLAATTRKFSKSATPTLVVHLPYYDYILFCLDLYVQGKMTLGALNTFIKEMYLRKEIYVEEIRQVCHNHQIELNILSPFESLFKPMDLENLIENVISGKLATEAPIFAQTVLQGLNLKTDENFYTKFNPKSQKPRTRQEMLKQIERELKLAQQQNEVMHEFIKNCLEKLKNSNLNPDSYQIWQDFTELQQAKFNKKFEREKVEWIKTLQQQDEHEDEPQLEEINNFECLFHIANASVLAIASLGQNPYEVVSLLPCSEKQIQRTHDELVNQDPLARYNPVGYLVMNDLYALSTKSALPFYCNTTNAGSLANNINEHQLLDHARQNVICQITGDSPTKISAVLPKPKLSPKNSPKRGFCSPAAVLTPDMYQELKNFTLEPAVSAKANTDSRRSTFLQGFKPQLSLGKTSILQNMQRRIALYQQGPSPTPIADANAKTGGTGKTEPQENDNNNIPVKGTSSFSY